jgi:hypothetical protein
MDARKRVVTTAIRGCNKSINRPSRLMATAVWSLAMTALLLSATATFAAPVHGERHAAQR